MKILNLEKIKNSRVNRKLIANFGESVYSCPEIRSVFIKVNFKDGSNIGFRRDEDEDALQNFLEEENRQDETE